MHVSLHQLCLRLEVAQAHQNESIAIAQARLFPGSGARCLRQKGVFIVYLGPGHMLNQALCLGLEFPMEDSDIEHIEAILGVPTVVELTPAAYPSAMALLARRGYRIQAFHQVWMREIQPEIQQASLPSVEIRVITQDQTRLFSQVVAAGFFERDELSDEGMGVLQASAHAEGTTCFLAWMGDEPIGAGTLAIHDDIATLSGTSVRPAFRGRGTQVALIGARLAYAQARGCTLATSSTLPHGPSQFNLQRCGFQIAYPKVEMIREE